MACACRGQRAGDTSQCGRYCSLGDILEIYEEFLGEHSNRQCLLAFGGRGPGGRVSDSLLDGQAHDGG